MTGDPRRWPNDGGATGVVHFFGPYPYRSPFWSDSARAGVRARARAPRAGRRVRGAGDDRRARPRVDPRHGRHPRAAGRLPRRRARDLRPRRHRLHRRRGDVRLRPRRRVVRRRQVGRPARPDHLRQGLQLRLRPARWRDHLRRDRGDVRRAGLPRRPDLLRSPAGLRSGRREHQRHARRGDRRQRPPDRRRTSSGPVCATWPSGTRRSARCAGSACSGRSTSSRTRRPARCWCPTTRPGEANEPMAELVAACKSARHAAVRELQPAARRAALHGHRGRRPRRGWRSSTRRSPWPTAHDRLTPSRC